MEENEKPDVLNIKKKRQQPLHFYYNREERLQLKANPEIPDPAGKKRMSKRNYMLIIISVFIIILLILVFVFRQSIR